MPPCSVPSLLNVALLVCVHATVETWSTVFESLSCAVKTKTLSWILHKISVFHEVGSEASEESLRTAVVTIHEYLGLFDHLPAMALRMVVKAVLQKYTADLSVFHVFVTSEALNLSAERTTRLDCLVRHFLVWMKLSWDAGSLSEQSELLTQTKEMWQDISALKDGASESDTPTKRLHGAVPLREALLTHNISRASKLFREYFEICEENQALRHSADAPSGDAPCRLPLDISMAFAMMGFSQMFLKQDSLRNVEACAETVLLNAHQTGNIELLCAAHYNRYRCSCALGDQRAASEDLGIALSLTQNSSSPTLWRLRALVFVAAAEQLLYHPGSVDEALHRKLLRRSAPKGTGMDENGEEEPSMHSTSTISTLRQSFLSSLCSAEQCALAIADTQFQVAIEAMCGVLRCESNRITAGAFDPIIVTDGDEMLGSSIASAFLHPKNVLTLMDALRISEVNDEPFQAISAILPLFHGSSREIVECSTEAHALVVLIVSRCLFHCGYAEAALRLLTTQRDEELHANRSKSTFNTILLVENLKLSFGICCAVGQLERGQKLLEMLNRHTTERSFAPGGLDSMILESKWLQYVGNSTHAIRIANNAVVFGKKLQHRRAVCEAQLHIAGIFVAQHDLDAARQKLAETSPADCTIAQQVQRCVLEIQCTNATETRVRSASVSRLGELHACEWSPRSGRSLMQILTVASCLEAVGENVTPGIPSDLGIRVELPVLDGVSLESSGLALCTAVMSLS